MGPGFKLMSPESKSIKLKYLARFFAFVMINYKQVKSIFRLFEAM